jgi:hypothetical protein
LGPAFANGIYRSQATHAGTKETEMSLDDGRPWEGSGEDLPWDTPDESWEPADTEAWRGDLHLGEWPESLAGPEYWLYKKEQGDE